MDNMGFVSRSYQYNKNIIDRGKYEKLCKAILKVTIQDLIDIYSGETVTGETEYTLITWLINAYRYGLIDSNPYKIINLCREKGLAIKHMQEKDAKKEKKRIKDAS